MKYKFSLQFIVIQIILFTVIYGLTLNLIHTINLLVFIPAIGSLYYSYKTYKKIQFQHHFICIYIMALLFLLNCLFWYIGAFTHVFYIAKVAFLIADVLIYMANCIIVSLFVLKNVTSITPMIKKHPIVSVLILFINLSINIPLTIVFLQITPSHIFIIFVAVLVFILICTLEIIVIGLIFCRVIAIQYIIIGVLLTINTVFLQTASPHNYLLFEFGQLSWYTGVCVFCLGLTLIARYNKTHQQYFYTWSSLRNIVTIRVFIISLITIAIFFQILFIFQAISMDNFLLMPLFISIFSIIIVKAMDYIFNDIHNEFNLVLRLINNLNQIKRYKEVVFHTTEFSMIKDFVIQNVNAINKINLEYNELQKLNHLNEIKIIQDANKYKDLLAKKQAVEDLAEKDKDFLNQISLLIHDIKSPTSLINNIIQQNNNIISKKDVEALELANNRILLLTYNLLESYKNQSNSDIIHHFNPYLIIKNLLTEFKAGYSHIIFQFIIENNNFFALLHGNSNMFKRMVVNLIDNAINILEGVPKAQITIRLVSSDYFTKIYISDNGPGMNDSVRDAFLNKKQVKSTKKYGNGIGLKQISETIKAFCGSCDIVSKPDLGTSFIITFPQSNKLEWVCDSIQLCYNQNIIILDDDINIHNLWDNAFNRYVDKLNLKIFHYETVEDFNNSFNNIGNYDKENTLLLSDYDIKHENYNGIDIITQFKAKNSILVTGHFEDKEIQQQVIKLGIKMLDKSMLNYIRVVFENTPHSMDMVWLDDQLFFPKYLVDRFYQHLKVDILSSPEYFLNNITTYTTNTIIIIDFNFNLNSNLTGLDIAEKIYKLGFYKLVILTSETEVIENLPPYIKAMSKSDERITNLDGLFFSS